VREGTRGCRGGVGDQGGKGNTQGRRKQGSEWREARMVGAGAGAEEAKSAGCAAVREAQGLQLMIAWRGGVCIDGQMGRA
jgi:hypothetical protein